MKKGGRAMVSYLLIIKSRKMASSALAAMCAVVALLLLSPADWRRSKHTAVISVAGRTLADGQMAQKRYFTGA